MEQNNRTAILRMVGGQLLEARRNAMSDQVGRPHQLEPVSTVNDVLYINDSKSTFLDATLEALGQMEGNVVWIAGDISSEMNVSEVRTLIKEKVTALIIFGRTTEVVANGPQAPIEHVYVAEELRTAVFLAKEIALAGATVLFSPAYPSGNGFANYEERGAEFKRAVRDL